MTSSLSGFQGHLGFSKRVEGASPCFLRLLIEGAASGSSVSPFLALSALPHSPHKQAVRGMGEWPASRSPGHFCPGNLMEAPEACTAQ